MSISYRSTYCNQRLKHLLSSLFASTFASRAVSSTDNKFQQSDYLDLKTLPFLTIQLVPIPRPPTAYKALDTSVLAQKGSPQTLHSSIPPRLLLPGIFFSSPPPCWLAGWLRVGGPPSSGGHGSGHAVGVITDEATLEKLVIVTGGFGGLESTEILFDNIWSFGMYKYHE